MAIISVLTLAAAAVFTPLHDAVDKGSTFMTQELLEQGEESVTALADDNRTALHIAANRGYAELVEMLIVAGAPLEALTNRMHLTPLHSAAFNGRTEAVKALVKAGASVEARAKEGLTPLHWAAHEGQSSSVVALIEAGAAIGAQSDTNSMPLHVAASKGHASAVKALIEAGARATHSALCTAASAFSAPCTAHLAALCVLQAGAPLEAQTDAGRMTPLLFAALDGHTLVVQLLVNAGASVSATNDPQRFTPLHWAASEGHAEVIRVLVEAGAPLEAHADGAWTPLHSAAFNGREEAAKALVDAGASLTARANEWGWTPLHTAAYSGHVDVAQGLLEAGADADARDEADRAPIALAEALNHTAVADLLRTAGDAEGRELFTRLGVLPQWPAAQRWLAENGGARLRDVVEAGLVDELVAALELARIPAGKLKKAMLALETSAAARTMEEDVKDDVKEEL